MNRLEKKLIVVENSIEEIRAEIQKIKDAETMRDKEFYSKYGVWNPNRQAAIDHCKMIRRTILEIAKSL